jgi:large subunit ribosomal protein L24
MKSSKARKQRKAFFNAPLHQCRRQIAAHLEENLLLKYDKRRIPVVRGDTVKIMRGAFKGHENKVANVHLKKHLVEVEGVTITKADGKQIAKSVHPSNLLITKLNLTDKWRRRRLEEGLSSETRKEIEKEATDQVKELEEQRKDEEQRRKEEEEAAAKEEEESAVEEETEEKPAEIEPEETKPVKKDENVAEQKKEKEPATVEKAEPVKESTEEKPQKKTTPAKEKKTPKKKSSEEKKEEQSEEEKEEKQ